MKLILQGTPGFDGEYECDISYFTNRELHAIKTQTGLRAGEFEEAFEKGDNDFMVAIAATALARAGKPNAYDVLWDMPIGKITFDSSDEEGAEDSPPESEPAIAIAGDVSGGGLSGDGDRQVSVPSPTGAPA